MIPKIIHFCWFGGNNWSPIMNKCYKSWKEYCHDYTFIEWNENNFSIDNSPQYVQEAYHAKKWAFVSDYVRLYALTTMGGVYLDTDVELLSPIDVYLENNTAFTGFEAGNKVTTGILASIKDFPLFIEFINYYKCRSFFLSDGNYDLTTNVDVLDNLLHKYGLINNNKFQIIANLSIYPKDHFCPLEHLGVVMEKTHNTCAIHWYTASWLSKEKIQQKNKWKRELRMKILLYHLSSYPKLVLRHLLGEGLYTYIKNKVMTCK